MSMSVDTGRVHRRRPKKDADVIADAIDRQTKDAGKWAYIQAQIIAEGLAAIALAASTPTDNSEEVQALTARVKAQADALEVVANKPD